VVGKRKMGVGKGKEEGRRGRLGENGGKKENRKGLKVKGKKICRIVTVSFFVVCVMI
jgi:hypothetical protein